MSCCCCTLSNYKLIRVSTSDCYLMTWSHQKVPSQQCSSYCRLNLVLSEKRNGLELTQRCQLFKGRLQFRSPTLHTRVGSHLYSVCSDKPTKYQIVYDFKFFYINLECASLTTKFTCIIITSLRVPNYSFPSLEKYKSWIKYICIHILYTNVYLPLDESEEHQKSPWRCN